MQTMFDIPQINQACTDLLIPALLDRLPRVLRDAITDYSFRGWQPRAERFVWWGQINLSLRDSCSLSVFMQIEETVATLNPAAAKRVVEETIEAAGRALQRAILVDYPFRAPTIIGIDSYFEDEKRCALADRTTITPAGPRQRLISLDEE